MKTLTTYAIALTVLAALAFGQAPVNPPVTPAPTDPVDTTTSFTVSLSPFTAPGGKSSVSGIESGMALKLTQNFDVREENITATGFQFYGAGVNYHLPALSKILNNASPNINGLQFDFYLTGALGASLTPSGPPGGHWAERVGGGFNYSLNKTWSLGTEIQYLKAPGYQNNAYTLLVGPIIHF